MAVRKRIFEFEPDENKPDVSILNVPTAEPQPETLAKVTEIVPYAENTAIVAVLQEMLEVAPGWEGLSNNLDGFRDVPGLTLTPMTCEGYNCPYAKCCPVLQRLQHSPDPDSAVEKLVGQECQVDLAESIKLFSAMAKELKIRPENTTDVMTLVNIVALHTLKRKMMWEINKTGIIWENPGVIHQPTGKLYMKKEANPLLKNTKEIQEQINSLTNQLAASREAKAKILSQADGIAAKLFTALAKRPGGGAIDTTATEVID